MQIIYKGKPILFFSTAPKDLSQLGDYYTTTKAFINQSSTHGFQGILTPENVILAPLDPWTYAHEILCNSDSLTPIIAINPTSAEPWIAAKRIINLTHLYKRVLYVNFIAGATSLKNDLPSSERYERLGEYITIILALLSATEPFHYKGKYYEISGLKLLVNIPPEKTPVCIVAGESESAKNIASRFNFARLTTFGDKDPDPDKKIWVACGVVTGETQYEADASYNYLNVENKREQFLLKYTTSVTNDSVWKKNLYSRINDSHKNLSYALYKNQISSFPYMVGPYDELADLLYDSIVKGVEAFIIEMPVISEAEFRKFTKVFNILTEKLNNLIT